MSYSILIGCICNMMFFMHIVCIKNIMLHMQPVFPTFDTDHFRDLCKYSRLPTERVA